VTYKVSLFGTAAGAAGRRGVLVTFDEFDEREFFCPFPAWRQDCLVPPPVPGAISVRHRHIHTYVAPSARVTAHSHTILRSTPSKVKDVKFSQQLGASRRCAAVLLGASRRYRFRCPLSVRGHGLSHTSRVLVHSHGIGSQLSVRGHGLSHHEQAAL